MARNRTGAIEIAIAVRDPKRLRQLAARARTAETRMLQMLVADLIDRQVRWAAGKRTRSDPRLRGLNRLLPLIVLLWVALAISVAALYGGAIKHAFTPVPGGHGCVNAGADARIDPFGLFCALQRRYSYRSSLEPKLHTHGTWAWGARPSYFVYNRHLASGKWLLLRLGWRYDSNWRGYIGPSLAWKEISKPLLYY